LYGTLPARYPIPTTHMARCTHPVPAHATKQTNTDTQTELEPWPPDRDELPASLSRRADDELQTQTGRQTQGTWRLSDTPDITATPSGNDVDNCRTPLTGNPPQTQTRRCAHTKETHSDTRR